MESQGQTVEQKAALAPAAKTSTASWLTWFNLGLRVLMETGIVLGLAYWGFEAGSNTATKVVFAIGAPLVGFGFWGAVDFRRVGRLSEPLRLIEELAISGLAAFALFASGQHVLGVILAAISIIYHVLVYVSGNRLLKPIGNAN
jgi:Protein of unknown function (DUF2568)